MVTTDVIFPSYIKVGQPIVIPANGKDFYARAFRVLKKEDPLAFGKLLAMDSMGSSQTPYGATNGLVLLINPEGLKKIAKTSDPVGHTAFLLKHEAWHALLGHAHRLKGLHHDTANRAADYAINWLTEKDNEKWATPKFPLLENCLYDERYADMSAIDIYRQLIKETPPVDPPVQPPINPGGDGDEEGEVEVWVDDPTGADDGEKGDVPPGKGNPTDEEADDGGGSGDADDGDDSDDTGDGGNAGDSEDTDGDGGGSDGGDDSDGGNEQDEGGDSSGSDSDILGDDWVGQGGEDTFEPEVEPTDTKTQEELEKEIEEANQKVILIEQMAHASGLGGGNGLRDVERLNGVTKPPFDWAGHVKHWMTDRIDEGWNKMFNTPMYSSTGLVCAGRESQSAGKLVIAVDTSGSIWDNMLKRFLLCIQEVLDELNPEVIHLLNIDCELNSHHELRPGDTVPETLIGGGGTCFRPAFEWTAKNCPDCDGLVYITDGDAYMGTLVEPDYPVLWMSWWKKAEDYPWGDAVLIEADEINGYGS